MTTAHRQPTNGQAPAARMHPTQHDLPAETRAAMIELLNQHLADTLDLYSQTKQAHWNVRGPEFFQLHELFDKLAGEVEAYVDLIAERATALGGDAMGTVRMSAANSRLPEYPAAIDRGLDHVNALADRYGRYAACTRQAIDTSDEAGDVSTSDLFTEISRGIDKSLWFLDAHVQAQT